MSTQIDINSVMAQIEVLRQRLAGLDVLIAEAEAALRSVDTALKTLDAAEKGGEVLVPGDPGFNVLIKANISDAGKTLLHIGGGIFARVDVGKARERLLERLETLGKTLSELRREREATLQQLAQLEYIVQLALASQQAPAKK